MAAVADSVRAARFAFAEGQAFFIYALTRAAVAVCGIVVVRLAVRRCLLSLCLSLFAVVVVVAFAVYHLIS